jgi:hypothetical protein
MVKSNGRRSSKSMKAQSMVFEQAMLFSISVAIFVACFAIFSLYNNHFSTITLNDGMDQVSEYIISNIVKLSEKKDANSSVILEIPRRINDQVYNISLTNEGLTLQSTTTRVSRFSNLYGMNEFFNLTGKSVSEEGKIIIYKKGNLIILQ